MNDETRQCSKCRAWKPHAEYYCGENLCRECVRETSRKYNQRPEIKLAHYVYSINRRAEMMGLPHTLTVEQWQHCLDYWGGYCAICGEQLNDVAGIDGIHADHFIPLSYKGDYKPGSVAGNMLPLCKACNLSKHNIPPGIWMEDKFGKQKTEQILAKILEYFRGLQ